MVLFCRTAGRRQSTTAVSPEPKIGIGGNGTDYGRYLIVPDKVFSALNEFLRVGAFDYFGADAEELVFGRC